MADGFDGRFWASAIIAQKANIRPGGSLTLTTGKLDSQHNIIQSDFASRIRHYRLEAGEELGSARRCGWFS